MIKSIRSEALASADKISKIELRDLKEISRYYMKNDYVSKEKRHEDLRKVRISGEILLS